MQTQFTSAALASASGRRADQILRRCVHCGLCNATCPTYQLLGDELDGPRGRIYLIKALLEQPNPDRAQTAQTHLDRCLTCRACETTCPSGVAYGELLEIGRETAQAQAQRGPWQRLLRGWLGAVAPSVRWFALWAGLGRLVRWALPSHLAAVLPARPSPPSLPAASSSSRRALLLQGCVQRQATPAANAAAVRYFNSRGVEAVLAQGEGCCGGLNLHLGQASQAQRAMRRNLDALAPNLERVEWIVSTASGCGVTLKDYGRLLAHDPGYAALAGRVAAKTRDLAEVAAELGVAVTNASAAPRKVAWHPPCTLQHGQRITGVVERLLTEAGHQLVAVKDAHLCCGSAGAYSVLQPALAQRLKQDKLRCLTALQPDLIATANVGCQMHLASAADRPVVHWAELLTPEQAAPA